MALSHFLAALGGALIAAAVMRVSSPDQEGEFLRGTLVFGFVVVGALAAGVVGLLSVSTLAGNTTMGLVVVGTSAVALGLLGLGIYIVATDEIPFLSRNDRAA